MGEWLFTLSEPARARLTVASSHPELWGAITSRSGGETQHATPLENTQPFRNSACQGVEPPQGAHQIRLFNHGFESGREPTVRRSWRSDRRGGSRKAYWRVYEPTVRRARNFEHVRWAGARRFVRRTAWGI